MLLLERLHLVQAVGSCAADASSSPTTAQRPSTAEHGLTACSFTSVVTWCKPSARAQRMHRAERSNTTRSPTSPPRTHRRRAPPRRRRAPPRAHRRRAPPRAHRRSGMSESVPWALKGRGRPAHRGARGRSRGGARRRRSPPPRRCSSRRLHAREALARPRRRAARHRGERERARAHHEKRAREPGPKNAVGPIRKFFSTARARSFPRGFPKRLASLRACAR